MKIMLIDDDIQTLDMFRNALEINGYECDVYEDSELAAASYSPYSYDVIVCDYLMPKINGIEVLKSIKAINPEALFILYSAYPEKSVISEAFSYGASDFINKPIEWKSFIELLQFYELATV